MKNTQLKLEFTPEWGNETPGKKGWIKINRKRRHYKNIGIIQEIKYSKEWGLYLITKN